MLLVLLAAAAQAAARPDAAAPPSSAPAGADRAHRGPRRQLFVAPSGEPFRAAADAPYPVADWFARANAAHDGRLTEAEFTADFVRFAQTLDLDRDGVIDRAEVQDYETRIVPEARAPGPGGPGPDGFAGPGPGGPGAPGGEEHGADGGRSGRGGADRPPGLARYALLPLPEPVAAMDTAGDGRITRAEVLAAAHLRFAALDTAHRGDLRLAELPESWVQSRRRMFRQRDHGPGGPPPGGRDGPGAPDFGGGLGGGFGGGFGGGGPPGDAGADQGN